MKRREFLRKLGVGSLAALGMPYFAAAQARPVKLATLLPLTGPFAFAGNAGREGFVDGVEYVNEVLGGIGGRRLELIVEDTGYDVARGTAAFNRVITRERPDELLFVYGDSTGLSKALAPEIARLNLPYSATGYANELANPQNYPTMFLFGPIYNDMMEALLRQVRLQRPRARIAFVYSNTEFGRDPIPYGRERARALGMEVVHEEITPVTITDPTPFVLNLRRANPDFIIIHGYILTVEPLILRSAQEQGLRAQFMGTYFSAEPLLIQRAGPSADGFVVTYHHPYWYEALVPAVEEMRRFRVRKGRDISYRPTYYMGTLAMTLGLAEAMRRAAQAGRLTRAGVVEHLEKIGDYNAMGLVRDFNFVNHRLPQTRLFRASVRDGRFNAITDWLRLG
ncbi:ABC transporter substrate-binding protein [Thermus thermamylovorans]|uniref:Branched-chain amino acid ABC transporter substrate-binding protein n=1 Tax=Thermus thermamylovorans TaxID=2509362 RepID=A0A4Q9B806_9DEIN|nr:ABC transporter substrate-binding protein [Thermus thermamylovorans]TBH21959.1 branched-chain amino acid ABC transporter substrate-binding protein [Thermus thermamylovorans]